MQYLLLGPFEVIGERGVVDLGSTKQRAVLAMLAVEANHVVSIDRLVDQLWGDDPPRSAVGSLHAYVSNLRRALEPGRPPRSPSHTLASRDPGYVLLAGVDEVDAMRFERLAAEGSECLRGGQPERAVALLDEALALWRGPILADFAYEPFAGVAARRFEQLRWSAAEDRIDAMLTLGRHSAVVTDLEEMVEADPLRERRWAQLMVALYRGGRQADALRAYQRARTALVDELGIEPGPGLQAIEQAVLAQDPDLKAPPSTVFPVPALPLVKPAIERFGAEGHVPLIGRSVELQEIEDALAPLSGGRGGALIVSGEPGVGKSTLLDALAARAEAAGFSVGVAQSPEGATAPPLWPWIQALRGVDEHVSLPDVITPTTVFDDLLARLRKLARERPVVIVLDDLQWADELSDQFLQFVLASVRDEPVLVAVGLRDPFEGGSEALLAVRSSMASNRSTRRVTLRGLGRDDVGALASRVSGDDGPSAAVVEALYQRTSGNPFFVTELVRLLRTEHALHDLDRMNAAGLPQGVRDVIRRRLARLPGQVATILSVAAVLGRRIDTRLVGHITGISTEELLDLLELATVAGLVSEDASEPGVYRFNHDLVREALDDSLPGLRRARLHSQAVDAIVTVRGDSDADAHELARHAVAAVPHTGPDPAVDRLARSAKVAQQQLAIELSEGQLRLALALLAEVPDTPARRRRETELEARLASIEFHARANATGAASRLQRARDICPAEAAGDYLRVISGQAAIAGLWGDLDTALSAAAEAVELGKRVGDRQAESDANYSRGQLAWVGAVSEALESLDASVAMADALEAERGAPTGTHVPLATKRALRSVVLALSGAVDEARRERRAAMSRALRDGGWSLSWSTAFGVFSATLTGDPDEVRAMSDRLPELGRGLAYTDALIGACRHWALATADEREMALFDAERDRLAAAGDGLMAAPLACLAAELRIDRGDKEGACSALTTAQRAVAASGAVTWSPEIDRLLVRAGRSVEGDPSGAASDADAVLARALAVAEAAGADLFAARIRSDLDARSLRCR